MWYDFVCITCILCTLAFWELCIVMKRRNQNVQVAQERKLIKLPSSHECNLFVWKDKGWNIPTDPQSLHNHRAGKHMNMPGKKFSIPGASANNGGKSSQPIVFSLLIAGTYEEPRDVFTRFPLLDRGTLDSLHPVLSMAWNTIVLLHFISLRKGTSGF